MVWVPHYAAVTAVPDTISLNEVLKKIEGSVVADTITHQADVHRLVADAHFGGRPGRSTTDAIHRLLAFSKDAWRRRKVVTFVYSDVHGAYPSVFIPKLTHNMGLRYVPKEYTDWITRSLQNRRTTIKFDDYESQPFPGLGGLDQGSCESGILYQFYNSDLIDLADEKNGEIASGYIDDAVFGVRRG